MPLQHVWVASLLAIIPRLLQDTDDFAELFLVKLSVEKWGEHSTKKFEPHAREWKGLTFNCLTFPSSSEKSTGAACSSLINYLHDIQSKIMGHIAGHTTCVSV